MWGQPPSAVRRAKPASLFADNAPEERMSTRSSIWLDRSQDKSVHIYWELAEREMENGRMTGAPVYIAVDDGDAEREIEIRLPKEIAIKLLTILSVNPADMARVI
ncbi:MAG: hypothetical protein DMG78_06935 [Acidobacteria bacterium]|nr:MAG: hypothetical protein DMG78_06935 [Acidobacteriota bacterium]